MRNPNFIILRTDSAKAETIGPRATIFNSFKKADEYAKDLSEQYMHQTFIVCQAVAEYQSRLTSSVKVLVSERPEADQRTKKRKSLKSADRNLAEKAEARNIVEMSSRKARNK